MSGLAVMLPFILPSFYVHVLIMTFLAASVASAWNIIGGFAGQFSLGHSVFFGIGGYGVAIPLQDYGISPVLGIPLGVLISVVLSIIIGLPTFKLRGHYFALATLAVVMIFLDLSIYFKGFTHGTTGIPLVDKPGAWDLVFRTKLPMYYLFLALLFMTLFLSYLISKSKIGCYFKAIREDEEAAEALGINSAYFKHVALIMSAMITSVAGSLYVCYILYIDSRTAFDLMRGIYWALLALVGGLGTVTGPIVGALLIEPFNLLLKSIAPGHFGAVSNCVYGILFVILALRTPEGVVVWAMKVFHSILEILHPTKNRNTEGSGDEESETPRE
jgi:branched-chain amino acid transport system permease protein